ncbi:type I restriction enzyme EcoKI subunit R [Solibacillus isronensis B3W22]|uniref:Type I restriction enzyme EcoKI subunit R n=1 Tax=Solibacillus isronensis B3W22 TaxID=1224748 RepID=K1L0L0_9BACL|nr:DNA phosphorothioation-dependent restriction protein DptF [Solibacillus isronensis]AMO86772.1 hypothetical protein SOLI23_14695 [Solibacillus silvestris]EKB45677.1 type I restriction enzyme EcoKI subunit R [Solibacillus isronensis B3W22]
MERYFLNFLHNSAPKAAINAKQMENLFFTDSSSALAKARLFIEEIIKSIWVLEKLDLESHDYRNLSDRINYLYRQECFESTINNAFHFIRKVGNDAVHVSDANGNMQQAYAAHKEMYNIAKWYIEFYTTEEIIIPPYEQPQLPRVQEIPEDLIKEKMEELLKTMIGKETAATTLTDEIKEEAREQAENELKHTFEEHSDNYLVREIGKLRISAAEAVENASSFSAFKNYLHVNRPIQEKVEEILQSRFKQDSNLILLSGSVGDGKSHLLAYLNQHLNNMMGQYKVFNDATESFSPSKTALETLEEILKGFSDQHIHESNEKVIIAINLGVLNNFVNREHNEYTYNHLKMFIEKSELFSSKILTHAEDGPFDLVSFADYQMFELTPNGAESNYFETLLQKICARREENPFYLAYKKDLENGKKTIIHENYEFLSNEFVQKQVVQIIIKVILQFKHSVSSRHFLNFVADILIPHDFKDSIVLKESDRLAQTLPHLLFNSIDRSQLLDYARLVNPLHSRVQVIDELLVTLNTLTDWEVLIEERIGNEIAKDWLRPFTDYADGEEILEFLINQVVNTLYLTSEGFAKQCSDIVYQQYLDYLYNFNKNAKPKIREFYKNFKTTLFNWKGSPISEYIYLDISENDFAVAQKLKLNPRLENVDERHESKLQTFKQNISVVFSDSDKKNFVSLDIDFALFQLLVKVEQGYRPNKKDEEDATTFIEFLEKLMNYGNKKDEVIIDFIAENKKYRLLNDEFEDQGFIFEKVD